MKAFLVILISIASIFGQAAETISDKDQKAVEDYLKTSLVKQFSADNVYITQSELPDFLEIIINGNLLYFHTASQMIFSGEIYDRNGNSVSSTALKRFYTKQIQSLTEPALIVNAGLGYPVIYEFTDPDCPYCQRAHNYLNSKNVERRIYFTTKIHPDARAKVAHIFCAKDKRQAMSDVYSNEDLHLDQCASGKKAAEQSEKASEKMLVNGTPTFFFDGNLVRGFNQQQLEMLIK